MVFSSYPRGTRCFLPVRALEPNARDGTFTDTTTLYQQCKSTTINQIWTSRTFSTPRQRSFLLAHLFFIQIKKARNFSHPDPANCQNMSIQSFVR